MGDYLKLLSNITSNSESDECYTPADQVLPLLKYLDKEKTYFEPTAGKSSNIIDGFTKHGYTIAYGGGDFFNYTRDDISVYDGIITNPPYSKKDDFIEHCYHLGKPFALLLPVSALQGNRRGKLFMEHGMSLLVYNRRIDFTGKGQPHFGNAWFIHGFLPPNQVFWVDNPPVVKKPQNT